MKNKTNFDIVNYVHLTYQGAKSDKAIIGNRSQSVLKSKKTRVYNRLEKNFISEVGISSTEFMSALRKSEEALLAIVQMFNCKTITEMKEYISKEKLVKLQLGEESARSLVSAAKTQGYAELINQLFSSKDASSTNEKINNIVEAFDGINMYKETLDYLTKDGQQSTNKKKQAMLLSLINEAFTNAKDVKMSSSSDKLFSTEFVWRNSSFDAINKILEDFKNSMKNGVTVKMADLEKIINSARGIINRDIKGASTGEYSSALISKALMEPVLKSVTNAINIDFQHTRTRVGTKTEIEIPIAGIYSNKQKGKITNIDTPMKKIADSIQKFVSKDQKADITVNYETSSGDKQIKISAKRYKTSAYAVNMINSMSIGSLLSFGKHGAELTSYYTGNSNIASQFYNALNFYLLQNSYGTLKKPDIVSVIKNGNGSADAASYDSMFGGILSKFLMDILGNILEPETSAFMDINGMLIPTPLYYKFMMDRFLDANIKNYVSSYIFFNANAFRKSIESSLTNNEITGAKKTVNNRMKWKTGYDYDIAAFKRNILIKDGILNQKVNVRTSFLELSQYREQILNTR